MVADPGLGQLDQVFVRGEHGYVLLDAEAARYTDRTAAAGLELEPGTQLREAAADVERARGDLGLTTALPTPFEPATPRSSA